MSSEINLARWLGRRPLSGPLSLLALILVLSIAAVSIVAVDIHSASLAVARAAAAQDPFGSQEEY